MKTPKKGSGLSYCAQIKRREFLGSLVTSASIGVIVAACNKNDGISSGGGGIDLGSGDTGILNYAYVLEQLQAAFYLQVITTPYSGMSEEEISLLTDIRDHENTHHQFLKTVIGSVAIPSLKMDFSSVNFSNRNSVLSTAKTFEDLCVSAYNGAGQLITNPLYLLVIAKIVSVEARHAAYIRDVLSYGSFADSTVVDTNGLGVQQSPNAILTALSPFLISKLDSSHLPTS